MSGARAVWQCVECGKCSNAKVRPRKHARGQEWCGPFAAVTIAPDGAVIAPGKPPAPERTGPFGARQSTLRGLQQCGRRTWHSIQLEDDPMANDSLVVGYTESSADLGTVMHAVAAAILRTLWERGEEWMPTQEAVEIAYEQYALSPIILPAEEEDDLIWLTLRFVERSWDMSRMIAIEERIDVPIVCQDGVTRILSCQPDLISQAGRGLVVNDHKSGRGSPKTPRYHQEDMPENVARGKQYLSGLFQAKCYNLAALHRYPAAEGVLFREHHLRSGQIREAYLSRADIEHSARQIGLQLQKLDFALRDGEQSKVWRPKAGKHCARQCPVARSCPIPAEQRGMGALESEAMADAQAARYVVVDALRNQLRDGLKTRYEETGYAARIGDGTAIAWNGGKGGAYAIVPVEDEQEVTA